MSRKEAIQKHVSDMLAIERYVLEAIGAQDEKDVFRKQEEARDLIIDLKAVLRQHVEGLEELAAQYEADTQATVKELTTRLLGVTTEALVEAREQEPLSRLLRDDYVALSLLAMAYTSFHTYGLTVGEDRISRLGQQHLKDLTPLLVQLSKELPQAVVTEVHEESDFPTNGDVGPEATANTQRAWRREVTESAAVAEDA